MINERKTRWISDEDMVLKKTQWIMDKMKRAQEGQANSNRLVTAEERIFVLLPRNLTVQDVFKLYITEQFTDHTVTQTNLNAQQFIGEYQNNLRPQSLIDWLKTTNRAEIITLLEVFLFMGYMGLDFLFLGDLFMLQTTQTSI